MTKKLMMLSAIFLSGCGGGPGEFKDADNCSIIISKVYSDKNIDARCICRDYEFTLKHTGPTSKARRVDIDHCNKLVGFPPDHWGELTVWAKDNFEWAKGKMGL